jgi:hypothetical protein
MRRCSHCGGSGLKHVHRTFFERFNYLAIYECRDCEHEELISRRHTFHFGKYARCPMCGTSRVTKLHGRDRIDRMVSGPLNTLKRLSGGKLYHCCFCRIQFYDRRKLAPRTNVEPQPSENRPAEAEPNRGGHG